MSLLFIDTSDVQQIRFQITFQNWRSISMRFCRTTVCRELTAWMEYYTHSHIFQIISQRSLGVTFTDFSRKSKNQKIMTVRCLLFFFYIFAFTLSIPAFKTSDVSSVKLTVHVPILILLSTVQLPPQLQLQLHVLQNPS